MTYSFYLENKKFLELKMLNIFKIGGKKKKEKSSSPVDEEEIKVKDKDLSKEEEEILQKIEKGNLEDEEDGNFLLIFSI